MPVIKSAIKKLRHDRRREKENDAFRRALDRALRSAKKTKSVKAVSGAVSIVDRAVKKNIIHKNRAARIKSSLARLAKPAPKQTKPATKAKMPVKKSATSKSSKKTTR